MNGRAPIALRFQLKVRLRGDCFAWIGHRQPTGYGVFNVNGKMVRAHRFAFEMAKGPVPVGCEVHHLCGHPWCVRPSHLVAEHRPEHMKGHVAEWKRSDRPILRRGSERGAVCRRGHPMVGDNVAISGTHRQCRTCHIEAGRRRRARI